MRAISIQQPWVWAITDLGKRVENRSWFPPREMIGERIAIHASKKMDPNGGYSIQRLKGVAPPEPGRMDFGAIVATAVILGWVHQNGSVSSMMVGEYLDDPWFFGPVGWVMRDVRKLARPIPCGGQLGLWEVPLDVGMMIGS